MLCWCSTPCLRVDGYWRFVLEENARGFRDLELILVGILSDSSAGSAGGGGDGHFDQFARVNVVDVAVDWDGLRHERTSADAGHVCDDGLVLVFDGEPLDELCGGGTGAFADICEAFRSEGGGFQAVGEEAAHHIVGEEEHAAIGVVDDEEFFGAEKFVTDDE